MTERPKNPEEPNRPVRFGSGFRLKIVVFGPVRSQTHSCRSGPGPGLLLTFWTEEPELDYTSNIFFIFCTDPLTLLTYPSTFHSTYPYHSSLFSLLLLLFLYFFYSSLFSLSSASSFFCLLLLLFLYFFYSSLFSLLCIFFLLSPSSSSFIFLLSFFSLFLLLSFTIPLLSSASLFFNSSSSSSSSSLASQPQAPNFAPPPKTRDQPVHYSSFPLPLALQVQLRRRHRARSLRPPPLPSPQSPQVVHDIRN
ncbi:hypothetical protein RchiOBHm_Chr5g0074501 [Rosa chinensis]|uniref:Uncharacterized protein n=1 Tax=Rosa chinensis TaxID=74649 RepID=A0A2P6QL68_ROSCH|nr:hypothetical protein RchiOBHm_Chr5g0074501 [Rosa chinensis]